MRNEIIIKRPYRHFKGDLYYVHDLVEDTETGKMYVSYQALYEPYKSYIRALDMFLEEIPLDREDNITGQKYRFELFKG